MNDQELEDIAIARDLARKPDIRFLAQVLFKIGAPSTARVGKGEEIPPLYVRLAHRITTRKEYRDLLIQAIETVS